MSARKIWGLRRMTDRNGRFKMTAVDQRSPIKNFIKENLGCGEAPWQDVAEFKKLLIERFKVRVRPYYWILTMHILRKYQSSVRKKG